MPAPPRHPPVPTGNHPVAPATLTSVTPSEFAAKWKGSTATERAGAQEHFIDLCRMLGWGTPNDDPTDEREPH